MNILYIGQYTNGTTSKMRADHLRNILKAENFDIIDTNVPFYNTSKIFRSLGFRIKSGPLITGINKYVLEKFENLSNIKYDIVWIDKAAFLKKNTINIINQHSTKLVHFTPDMAFYENQSSHFNNSLPLFDFVVTTKTTELIKYKKFIPEYKLIKTTQGFSKAEHLPTVSFNNKEPSIAFVGLAEKSRFRMAELLIQNEILLKVAGKGWKKFAHKHKNNPFFQYYGEGVFGKKYVNFISSSSFSLGLLSKNFPELHTTRTFEIPACGTALITERNEEINSFFNEDEVIFYSSPQEMIRKIKYYLKNRNELQNLTRKGYQRVHKEGFSYESILRNILDRILA